ncbi:MAG: TIGR04211 family SH3 domain-containing protein [Chromatocurvus sp.]
MFALRSLAPALRVLVLGSLLLGPLAQAQNSVFVSDEVFIVLHAGPGTNYRWIAKLNPGTALTSAGTAEDGEWTEVTTATGTSGWVQSEFLSREKPAQVLLPEVQRRLATLEERNAALRVELDAASQARENNAELATTTQAELQSTAEELAALKKTSSRAIQLDTDNRRLVEDVETLRSEVDMLKADNQRLSEKLRSGAFLDGALAVLLGVGITLVVPRLWPRRRSSSSWA